jgi:hypothetical protein
VCKQEAAALLPLLTRYHAPAGWTWIIACDEMSWQKVIEHVGQIDVNGRILGLTQLDDHRTYIRGYDLLQPVSFALEAQPKHTVAHELGHIFMHTRDEDKAESTAKELLRLFTSK